MLGVVKEVTLAGLVGGMPIEDVEMGVPGHGRVFGRRVIGALHEERLVLLLLLLLLVVVV